MHAASVNPEPGSNSLKNCISSVFRLKPFLELICSFTFVWVVFSRIARFVFAQYLCFVLHLLLFNFQWPICCSSFFVDSLSIISQLLAFVKHFFQISWKIFSAHILPWYPPLSDSLNIILLFLLFVNRFFYFFIFFIHFRHLIHY